MIFQKQEPICNQHQFPCRFICPDPSCPITYLCQQRQCVQNHMHSTSLISVHYLEGRFKQFEGIKDRIIRDTQQLIASYYDKIAEICMSQINSEKQNALRKLRLIEDKTFVDIPVTEGFNFERVKEEMYSCSKKEIIWAWNLIRQQDSAFFKGQSIDKLIKEINLKNQTLEKECSIGLSKMPLSLYNGIEIRNVLGQEAFSRMSHIVSKTMIDLDKLTLLFNAAEHDFNASKFHELCDGKGPTLTIFKINADKVCGGFAWKSWKSQIGYMDDTRTFIFLPHGMITSKIRIGTHLQKGPSFFSANGDTLLIMGNKKSMQIKLQNHQQVSAQNYYVFGYSGRQTREINEGLIPGGVIPDIFNVGHDGAPNAYMPINYVPPPNAIPPNAIPNYYHPNPYPVPRDRFSFNE